ncbi:Uncharacterised protein [Nocardia brasiliensis]|nr:Uncharacterised protein [Nocardia brasiliensis]
MGSNAVSARSALLRGRCPFLRCARFTRCTRFAGCQAAGPYRLQLVGPQTSGRRAQFCDLPVHRPEPARSGSRGCAAAAALGISAATAPPSRKRVGRWYAAHFLLSRARVSRLTRARDNKKCAGRTEDARGRPRWAAMSLARSLCSSVIRQHAVREAPSGTGSPGSRRAAGVRLAARRRQRQVRPGPRCLSCTKAATLLVGLSCVAASRRHSVRVAPNCSNS